MSNRKTTDATIKKHQPAPLPVTFDFGGPLGNAERSRCTCAGSDSDNTVVTDNVDNEAFQRKPPAYPSLF